MQQSLASPRVQEQQQHDEIVLREMTAAPESHSQQQPAAAGNGHDTTQVAPTSHMNHPATYLHYTPQLYLTFAKPCNLNI